MSDEEKNRQAKILADEFQEITDAMGSTGFTADAASKAKFQLRVFRRNLADYTKHFAGQNDEFAKQFESLADSLEKQVKKDSMDNYV